jgi:AraC-like DNA-binding protein
MRRQDEQPSFQRPAHGVLLDCAPDHAGAASSRPARHDIVAPGMAGGSIVRPLVSAVVEVAVAHGAPRQEMVAAAGLETDAERVPIERLYDAWELALRSTRDPSLPVRVGQLARFDRYGVLGMILYVSATMEAAARRLVRYHDLLTDSGHWHVRQGGEHVIAAWHRDAATRLGARAANEQVLASFATVCRQITVAFRPTALHLRHAPPDESLAAHVGAPRVVADEDAIVIPLAWLRERPLGSDPHVEQFLLAQIAAAVGDTRPPDSVVHQVAALLVERIADGAPPIVDVAAALATPERTLRRRLADEGTSYEAVLVSVQRERALALLARDHPIQYVALAVGFADASAFSRAFRRWTGETPTAARRRLRTPV